MQTKRKLEQAKQRQQLKQDATTSLSVAELLVETVRSNKIRTRQAGPLHKKNSSVWCMLPPHEKKKEKGPFYQIQQVNSWNKFKMHIVYLQDEEMGERIISLIAANT